jgi:hypothetical protein
VLCRKIYTSGKSYLKIDDLKVAIRRTWANLGESLIRNLYNSLPQCIYELIQIRGGSNDY